MKRLPGLVALAMTLIMAAQVRAADEIHWTIMGQNAITLDWRGQESVVQYGLTSSYGTLAFAHRPDILPWSSPGPFWEAPITGLLPDTLYHYAIGNGADHTFRTPPPPGTGGFSVYVEGDIGSTLSFWRVGAVQQLIGQDLPRFTLMVGDLTYANAHGPEEVDQHFNDVMVWSQDAAYMPAWGNHEYETDSYVDDLRNYKGRVDLPNAATSPGVAASSCCGKDWYWFDYGNVRFIAYPEPTSGAWAEWYPHADSLMSDAQKNANIGFIVTFGHRPAYSSGNHPGSPSLKNYLDGLGAKYPKYRLNLNGHSHDYERSYPQNGVIHITAGGGGATLEQESGSCLWKGGCPAPAWSAFRAFHHGAVKLEIGSDEIKVLAVCGPAGGTTSNINDVTCDQGSVLDSVTIRAQSPIAHIDSPATDMQIQPGDSLYFSGTVSDPDGDGPFNYTWDFGGGASNSTLQSPGWVRFLTGGQYRVTFTGTDQSGEADLTPDTRTITVGNVNRPPDGQILSPAGPVTIQVGQSIAFHGAATDPDGDAPLSYRWSFDDAGIDDIMIQDPGSVVFPMAGTFIVNLTVTDPHGLSDPTPAEVEVTVTSGAGNQPPVAQIQSPGADVTIPAGQSVNFQGLAADPDGNVPLVYKWTFGGGAPDASVEDPGAVTFASPGVFTVTFSVQDALGAWCTTPATRTITVNGVTNDPPVPALALEPATGNAPLMMKADGSASADSDGVVSAYTFDFGDGTVVGPTADPVQYHTYVAGSYTAQLTVTDNRGAQRTTASPVIVAPVIPGINFAANGSVETNLTGWAPSGGGTLARVPGGFQGDWAMQLIGPYALTNYGLNDSPNWVAQTSNSNVGQPYRFSMWVRSPSNKGKVKVQVREFQGATKLATTNSPLVTLTPNWQLITVDATVIAAGTTLDCMLLDTPVAPAETVLVDNVTIKALGAQVGVDPATIPLAFDASFAPNPMHAAAAIRLAMPGASWARVDVIDLSGRRVRSLLDEASLSAGVHSIAFDGADPMGVRLPAGVYFYRVETGVGRVVRRFALLR